MKAVMWMLCCFLLILFGFVWFSWVIMARKMLIDGELENSKQEEAHYDFDLFVIGAGSGGVRAARFSAQFGAKVLIKNFMCICVLATRIDLDNISVWFGLLVYVICINDTSTYVFAYCSSLNPILNFLCNCHLYLLATYAEEMNPGISKLYYCLLYETC